MKNMKKLFNKYTRALGSLILFLGTPLLSNASSMQEYMNSIDPINAFIIGLLVFIVFVLAYMIYVIKVFIDCSSFKTPKDAPALSGFMKTFTGAVPVEKEEAILTDHVYDGIRELDNNLPPWWKYLFYATIAFAGVYLYYYHSGGNGQLQIQEYEQEMLSAEEQQKKLAKLSGNSIDENNVKVLKDADAINKGKEVYIMSCAPCHGDAGEGKVGPNLTDEFWLHGGGVKNIFKSIKYGIPDKGMISWKTQLSPSTIQEIASYIVSIQGTNPANAKAPQGDKYDEKAEVTKE
jgi:cytochrome c oxidase cbb3-type subunit 3